MTAVAQRFARLTPGLTLCLLVTGLALLGERVEAHAFGRPWLEALVLAIVFGVAVRTLWRPSHRFDLGIDFSAKTILEVGVVLLGLSISAAAIIAAGPLLMVGIAVTVVLTIVASYAIGRGFGLAHRMAVLIACGNAICGNTAIVAAAPAIKADGEEVGAAIAFTAVFGLAVVVLMPLVTALIGLGQFQSGVFAGLTIYSVSQVVAATAPIGPASVQIGMLVKLARMLLLGPIVLALTLAHGGADTQSRRLPLSRLVPWYMAGFLVAMAVRSTGLVPAAVLGAASAIANVLLVFAMAGLGLSVDLRALAKVGVRVSGVVVLSLGVLAAISLAVIALIGAR